MKARDKLSKVGRAAFRVEGTSWNVYWALPDTMKGAVFIGSIAMACVQRQDRKQAFIAFIREVIGDLFEEQWGVRPEWPDGTQPAPEHERTRE